LTDVPAVFSRWPSSEGEPLGHVTPDELRALAFDPGSMAPKVAAACRFAERTGRMAAIGALDQAEAVLAGQAGTIVAWRDARRTSH
jgi:carbamate kinase